MKQLKKFSVPGSVTAKRLRQRQPSKNGQILCLHRTADRSLFGANFWKSSAPITAIVRATW